MNQRALRHLIGPAVLFVLTICFCWKLVLTNQYTWMDGPDIANQVLPWFQYQAGEFHAGRFPLWDPYHWLGQPLIGQAQPGTAYPPNWILFALPLHNGWISQKAMHWYFLGIHFLAALFMYWLCRDLGRSRSASVIAGLVFAFGGFVGTNDWPQMLNGCVWAPLVFLFLLRVRRGERIWQSTILGGFFLGMSWLSGHHQIPIFVTLATGGMWLYLIARRRDLWVHALVFFAMLFATSALQTLPALEYGRNAKRWVGVEEPVGWNQPVPYHIHRFYSYAPATLLGFALPGMSQHVNAFMGLLAISLAILAICLFRHQAEVAIFCVIGLLGLIYSLGGFSLLEGVLYAVVPLVEKARTPGNAVFLCNLSIACLSAFGIDYLASNTVYITRYRNALLGIGVFLASISLAILELGKQLADERILISALLAVAAAGALWVAMPPSRWAVYAIGFLIISEVGMIFGYNWANWSDPNHSGYLRSVPEAQEAVQFLRTRVQPLRVDVDDKVFGFNVGDYYGIETLGGYLASLTSNLVGVETHGPRTQALFSVKYHLGKQARFAEDVLVYEGKNGVKIFEYPPALPRVRTVHQVHEVADRKAFNSFISDPTNDLVKVAAFVGRPPDLDSSCGPADDRTRLTHHNGGNVRIEANLKCRGMVILADTYFPGWSATVDGKPAKIWEAYGVLRGVVAEPGSHVIEMKYLPRSVVAGAILSLLALGTVLGATLAGVRNRNVAAS